MQDLLRFIRRVTDVIKLKVCGKQGVNPDAGLSRLTYLKISASFKYWQKQKKKKSKTKLEHRNIQTNY